MKTQRVVSSGGVIFRVTNGLIEAALISKGRIWCLPKGLIEKGETADEAARREVREETGLEGEIISKIGTIKYDFIKERHVFKTVHFYLLRSTGGSIHDHDSEVDNVKWFSISEARKILTYPNEVRILEKAGRILRTKGLPLVRKRY